jgi:hypothetical protein
MAEPCYLFDQLRQEMWCFLFHFGGSQGLYPRQWINMYFPIQFIHYLCIFLEYGQVPFEVKVLKKLHCQLYARLIYTMPSALQSHSKFTALIHLNGLSFFLS